MSPAFRIIARMASPPSGPMSPFACDNRASSTRSAPSTAPAMATKMTSSGGSENTV